MSGPRRLGGAFFLRRFRRLVASLFAVVLASFLMIHMIPGDPVRAALGDDVAEEAVEARRAALGLNDNIAIQFGRYVGNLAQGELGESINTGRPVADTISQRFPETLLLAGVSFVFSLAVALPLGIGLAAVTRGGRRQTLDRSVTVSTVLLGAVPEFLIAVGLVWIFAVKLGWFPVAGHNEGWKSLVLPALALSTGAIAAVTRIARVETQAVLDEDYMRTARSKRLPTRLIYLRHALPNALTATLTISGLLLGVSVAGTVLIENVFAWPGLGTTVVEAIVSKDYSLVQAIVLLFGLMVLVINFLVDLALALLDPRSRLSHS